MDDSGHTVTLQALSCSRCSAHFQPLGARVETERVCPACEFRSAREPLATQRLESRGYRRMDRLHDHPKIHGPETFLKVVVHLAGIAALLAFLGNRFGVTL